MAKNKKHENDKFYTKSHIAKSLVDNLDISKYDLIIEPSAGNGSFFNIIESDKKIGMDIFPECDNIIKMDWFEYKPDTKFKKILIIGNPPFGNQGSLALKFIKKCDEIEADTIAFILPKSFKKDTYKRKIPSNYNLISEIDLHDDSFTLENKNYNVPCVFQVWERTSIKRVDEILRTTSPYIRFVKKSESPDYAFRRVGFYAGKIYIDYLNKSEQSHYFIKSDSHVKNIIENILWKHNNTSGPRSIGKSELIKAVESIISASAK